MVHRNTSGCRYRMHRIAETMPFTVKAPNIHDATSESVSRPCCWIVRTIATGPVIANRNAMMALTTVSPRIEDTRWRMSRSVNLDRSKYFRRANLRIYLDKGGVSWDR